MFATLWWVATAFANEPAVFRASEFGSPDKMLTQSGSEIDLEALAGPAALYEPVHMFSTSEPWWAMGRAVGMLDLLVQPRRGPKQNEVCTATLIAPHRVITNYHCVPGDNKVVKAFLHLGYLDRTGAVGQKFPVTVKPLEASKDLDYSILEVTGVPVERYPPLSLRWAPPRDGQSLYVWHHPLGFPQRLTRHGCLAGRPWQAPRQEGVLLHHCDTQDGSSGALLLDHQFNVVGLHYGGLRDDQSVNNFATPMGTIIDASPELRRLAAAAGTRPVPETPAAGFDWGGSSARYAERKAEEACEARAKQEGQAEWARRLDAAVKAEARGVAAAWAKDSDDFATCPELRSRTKRDECKSDLERFVAAASRVTASVAAGMWTVTHDGVTCDAAIDGLTRSVNPPARAEAQALLAALDRAPSQPQGGAPLPRIRADLTHPVLGTLRKIPGGTFTMGSTDGGDDEKPPHEVKVSTFYLMESEVTQGMWASVMGGNPSGFDGCDECPVETVSWEDAVAFARKVSKGGTTYRLPTEAEWEYAARGGESYRYAGSNDLDAVGWYRDNSEAKTHPVCGKQRNGFELCDMSGNVWEWVSDWYGPYSGRAQTNPAGPTNGSNRVFRGGGWSSTAGFARVAYRFWGAPGNRYRGLGFRLARSIP